MGESDGEYPMAEVAGSIRTIAGSLGIDLTGTKMAERNACRACMTTT